MISDYLNYFGFMPRIPGGNDAPPKLYDLMNSIVNYDQEEQTKIRNLAKEARTTIFDFEYPLTDNVEKEDFECMILNHFINRRIGFETFTLFQIQLENKLNSIMPIYNKMFDSIEGWDLFNDGDTTERSLTDKKTGTSSSSANNTLTNTSTTDSRFSDTPENQISQVQSGEYVTNYSYNTDNSNTTGTTTGTGNSEDNQTVSETIKHSPADKIAILEKMQNSIKSVYDLIFKDLDSLFYQLI